MMSPDVNRAILLGTLWELSPDQRADLERQGLICRYGRTSWALTHEGCVIQRSLQAEWEQASNRVLQEDIMRHTVRVAVKAVVWVEVRIYGDRDEFEIIDWKVSGDPDIDIDVLGEAVQEHLDREEAL